MLLLIPHPVSTAIASYVASISNMSIFSVEEDASVLARDTANFYEYERVLTPPEGFLPVCVVADKLTHLGRPWKPAVIHQGRNWSQVIAADDVHQLGWDAYDQMGRPPQDD
ncbi:hypothetical protein FCOIX_8946 [Fusarium coicis]|nr:hypothetical protein FCOIX_8946 [Fusarium coicis]